MRTISLAAVAFLLAFGAFAQSNEPWAGPYLYDGAGNVKAIGPNHYVYDGVNRLREGTAITAAQSDVQRYAYDAFGNVVSVTTGNTALVLAVDSTTNRVDKAPVCPQGSTCFLGTFDESGNQTSFASTIYVFDSVNMVSEVRSLQRNQLQVYDAEDERVATVDYVDSGNQTWHYTVRDADKKAVRLIDDVVVAGTHSFAWKKDYVHRGKRHLAAVVAGSGAEQTLHFHLDPLGTPRLITGAAARKIAEHTYWPFGAETPGSSGDDEKVRFTGQERDSFGDGNDLDYMHARHRSSVSTRFMATDPGPPAAGNPQSWNRYAYVQGNPLKFIDQSGQRIGLAHDSGEQDVRRFLVREIMHPTGRADLTDLANRKHFLVIYANANLNDEAQARKDAANNVSAMHMASFRPSHDRTFAMEYFDTSEVENYHKNDTSGVWTAGHEDFHILGWVHGLSAQQLHKQDVDESADKHGQTIFNEPTDMTEQEAEDYLDRLLNMDPPTPPEPVRMTDTLDDDTGLPVPEDY